MPRQVDRYSSQLDSSMGRGLMSASPLLKHINKCLSFQQSLEYF